MNYKVLNKLWILNCELWVIFIKNPYFYSSVGVYIFWILFEQFARWDFLVDCFQKIWCFFTIFFLWTFWFFLLSCTILCVPIYFVQKKENSKELIQTINFLFNSVLTTVRFICVFFMTLSTWYLLLPFLCIFLHFRDVN